MLAWVPRWVRWTFPVVVVAAVVALVIWPQLGEAEAAWAAAGDLNPWLLLAATGVQVASVGCQVQLTRVVLPEWCRPTFTTMARVEGAAMAVSHTVPGGTAVGTAVAYRLLRQDTGIPAGDAGFALAIRGIGSAVVLNVILWLALVVSIPAYGFAPAYSVAAGLGVLLLSAFGMAIWLVMRGERGAERMVISIASRLPMLDPEGVTVALRDAAERLRNLVRNRRLAVVATAWSGAYWLLSATSLWIFLAALGRTMRVDQLLVTFGVANVLAALPITPRGLGLVEAALVPSLVGFGASVGTATLAVIAWRLISFWLPIPLGGLAYASLKVLRPRMIGDSDVGMDARERLRLTTEEARREIGDLGKWARRHGFRVRDDE